MPRGRDLGVAALTLALVVGAVAAFVQAQVIKAERPAVRSGKSDDVVSPRCRCERATATLTIKLASEKRVDATIVDSEGREVRSLVRGALRGAGPSRFEWNGRDDAGAVVPEGTYRLRVDLSEPERSVTLGREIQVKDGSTQPG